MILLDDFKKIMIYGDGKELTYEDLEKLEKILGPTTCRSIFEYDDIFGEIQC